ncbi:Hypothetical predicted protein [Olea europaea subsp. europaea]|uniref:Organ-specific protein S2 n=1 Tax=Olea europaea subsp. europaea TaxID=158383 RepID=A0A8S0T2C2_OLEEU|nr:Hypothetical predicted protein [Olea europaea subsp. europaea]
MNTRTSSVFFLLSLVLISSVIDARKDPGEYWKSIMNGEPMPKAITDRIQDSNHFMRNFDTKANVIIYHSHVHSAKTKPSSQEELCEGSKSRDMPQQAKKQELSVHCAYKESNSMCQESNPHTATASKAERKRGKDERNRCSSGGFLSSSDNQDKPFVQEFEPKPSAKAYRDDKLKNERAFVKDFEPRPSATSYLEDKLKYERTFTTNFEPRPRATTYHHDKSFVKDFEPRPNVSSYTDDGEQGKGKSFVTAFEPRPNVSAYIDDVGLNEKKTFEKDFEP